MVQRKHRKNLTHTQRKGSIDRNKRSSVRKSQVRKRKFHSKTKKLFGLSRADKKRMYILVLVTVCILLVRGVATNIDEIITNENGFVFRTKVNKSDFIDTIEGAAIKSYQNTGVLPSIIISQAILESDWGRSRLAVEADNLFGIKADPSWNGRYVRFKTKENYNDIVVAKFRRYSSWRESIYDHGAFLAKNKRYREHGLFNTSSYKKQAQALEEAGYATTIDETGEKIYANNLIEIIEQYKLYNIDEKALRLRHR